MKKPAQIAALASLASSMISSVCSAQTGDAKIDRGRYLIVITGCNDCHTPGYPESGGKIAVERWLVGNALGHRGPWGTTYATNLRNYFAATDEDQWVKTAKSLKTRPPMPWFSLNAISEDDLRAMHAFVRSLGPGGEPAPKALPPGAETSGPNVVWPAPG